MVSATMRRVAADETHLSEDPVRDDAVMFGLVRLLGSPSPPEPLVDAFKRIGERPVLLIAGNDPSEAELGPVYASVAPETVALWSLPDTGHIQALSTHPDEYRTRVLSVFDRAARALKGVCI